ncbi:hypothetical protein LCGC14_0427420 [marine sediment metagenome]|uniref:DUF932 domain-containing protein n=1 Tax=marine sediment metagenome TaxID=412755 RepID=A0A0F9T718_9ZZZZ
METQTSEPRQGYNRLFDSAFKPITEKLAGKDRPWEFGVGLADVQFAPGAKKKAVTFEGWKTLYRTDTGEALSVVSAKYKPVLHHDVLDGIDSRILDSDLFKGVAKDLVPMRRVALFENGARMKAEYRFPAVRVDIGGGDLMDMTLNVTNSMDRTLSVTSLLGAFRLVCKNGMIIGIKFNGFRGLHTSGLDIGAFVKTVTTNAEVFKDKVLPMFQAMRKAVIGPKTVVALLEPIREKKTTVSKKYLDMVFDRFSQTWSAKKEGTVWGLYNDFTYIGSHNARGEFASTQMLKLAGRVAEQAMEIPAKRRAA